MIHGKVAEALQFSEFQAALKALQQAWTLTA